MPNWCENELYVIGTEESLLQFEDQVLSWEDPEEKGEIGSVIFDFDKVVPIPESLRVSYDSSDMKKAHEMLFGGWGEYDPAIPILLPDFQRYVEKYSNKNACIFNTFVFKEAMTCKKTIAELAHEHEQRALLFKTNLEKYNCSSGYEWCVTNWGTKWSAKETTLELKLCDKARERFLLNLDFSTAWSPPIPVIDKLGLSFKDTQFCLKYWESGVGFKGIHWVVNDEVINSATGNYRGNRGG